MGILRVFGLLWATSAFAATTPADDIYSDSLTMQRGSAEVPGSLEASNRVDLDTTVKAEAPAEEEPLESISDVVKASKPKAKNTARNKTR